jgi:hypothetical protein
MNQAPSQVSTLKTALLLGSLAAVLGSVLAGCAMDATPPAQENRAAPASPSVHTTSDYVPDCDGRYYQCTSTCYDTCGGAACSIECNEAYMDCEGIFYIHQLLPC